MPISPDEFLRCYPVLYHVSLAESFESIQRLGLLSTSAILDRFEVTGERRRQLERCKRKAVTALSHPEHGTLVLNDQSPLQDGPFSRCLRDLSQEEWIMKLNARVFFFPSLHKVGEFAAAKQTRDRPRILVQVSTQALFDLDPNKIELSAINAGSAMRKAPERGPDTFATMENYPFEYWKKRRGCAKAVAEVTFLGFVPPGNYLRLAALQPA